MCSAHIETLNHYHNRSDTSHMKPISSRSRLDIFVCLFFIHNVSSKWIMDTDDQQSNRSTSIPINAHRQNARFWFCWWRHNVRVVRQNVLFRFVRANNSRHTCSTRDQWYFLVVDVAISGDYTSSRMHDRKLIPFGIMVERQRKKEKIQRIKRIRGSDNVICILCTRITHKTEANANRSLIVPDCLPLFTSPPAACINSLRRSVKQKSLVISLFTIYSIIEVQRYVLCICWFVIARQMLSPGSDIASEIHTVRNAVFKFPHFGWD